MLEFSQTFNAAMSVFAPVTIRFLKSYVDLMV